MEITKVEKGMFEVKVKGLVFTIEKIGKMMESSKWAISQNGVLGRRRFKTAKCAMVYLQRAVGHI